MDTPGRKVQGQTVPRVRSLNRQNSTSCFRAIEWEMLICQREFGSGVVGLVTVLAASLCHGQVHGRRGSSCGFDPLLHFSHTPSYKYGGRTYIVLISTRGWYPADFVPEASEG